MLQLKIDNSQDYRVLEDRVKSLLIPSEICRDNSVTVPQVLDNTKLISGVDAINNYLDDLESFTKQWYACRCDMFPQ
tara:strand:- start:11 stop:241 length:231 start_codon:yes stop_codon:yes gene_type:complete